MKKEKHIPLRKCLACGEMKPKSELFRIYMTEDGSVELDRSFKSGGRGAYICRNKACISRAAKAKRIERAVGACGEDFYTKLSAEADNEG